MLGIHSALVTQTHKTADDTSLQTFPAPQRRPVADGDEPQASKQISGNGCS